MKTILLERYIREHNPNGVVKLAREVDCSVSLIHKVRKGHSPNVEFAKRLARVLGVSLDELCEVKRRA